MRFSLKFNISINLGYMSFQLVFKLHENCFHSYIVVEEEK